MKINKKIKQVAILVSLPLLFVGCTNGAVKDIEDRIEKFQDTDSITVSDVKEIKQLKRDYDALDDNAKIDVENAEKLTSIEDKCQDVEQKAISDILEPFKFSRDNFSGIETYYPNAMPKLGANRLIDIRTYVLPFIGRTTDKNFELLGVVDYCDTSWLFIDSFDVSVDGNIIYKSSDNDTPTKFKRVVCGPRIAETYLSVMGNSNSTPANEKLLDMFRKVADADVAIVRFNGESKCEDFEISDRDKQDIKKIIDTWDAIMEIES